MKRLTVFAPKGSLDELMKKLIRLRCVEISEYNGEFDEDEFKLNRVDCDARRRELEASLSETNQALTVLNAYANKFKNLIPRRAKINADAFAEEGHYAKAKQAVHDVLEAETRKSKIKEERARYEADMAAARPYVEYDAPLGLTQTECADVILGVLPAATNLEECGKALYKAGAIANILKSEKNGVYAVFFCHKTNSAEVNAILNSYGFLKASFAGVDVTARECIREAQRKLRALAAEEEALQARMTELVEMLGTIEALWDIEATELVSVNEKLKLASTDDIAVVSGWIPCRREAAVCDFLDRFECAYDVREPEGEEIPPILLQNNGFASSFEWVLGMYSYPVYGRFDPTFIMSIFYFLIFGIMFADVGYGLVLVLACFGAVAVLRPADGLKRSLKMFGYCGISCVVFGVLFGSYFGDLPFAIMRNMMGMTEEQLPRLSLIPSAEATLAVFLDPLQNPMGFLIFALGVGVVHLITGMAVKFFILCRDGKVLDAILDIGLYWVLFAGIGVIFVSSTVGICIAAGAAVIIVLTHGRAEKNIFMKLGKGLIGLYDLVSYASDLLSYSRILALGLSSAIIGQVVNILGTMIGPSVLGFIMLVAVFILGHTLNLAINVLGTFVHTARLQYIEFFGKFYEDGGIPFEPAVPSEKYTEQKNKE